MDNRSIKKLEADLWESADLLRAGSKLTSNQYCMPVLGLLFLRYAYSRFKLVEAEILKDRPMRNGRKMPVEAKDFSAKSALFLPREAQYDYLVNLPENIASADLKNIAGQAMNSLGEVVNNAMELVEQQSEQLAGVLPKSYTDFSDELLGELLRIFNNNALDEVGGDVIGRIYEYFLNKFAKNIASDDGVFFTPKSLVKMIVNILEPTSGVLLDPACGSGGMFVQTGDFVNEAGLQANSSMTFYGQEKVEYNAQLCLMNMAVHGLTGVIKSGDEANTFYHDAHNLEGCCDYVMANPPFNVDKVKAESTFSAGRLPFGCPKENKNKEIGNANYLWISYFYAYLKQALSKLNSWLTPALLEDAIKTFESHMSSASLMQINEEKYRCIRDGIPVKVKKPNGQIEEKKARETDPTIDKEELIEHMLETISAAIEFLCSRNFELEDLIKAKDFSKLALLQTAANAVSDSRESRKQFTTYANEINRMMKYLDRDDISDVDRDRKDALIAIADELKKKKRHVDNVDLMVQINGILGEYIMIEQESNNNDIAKRFDISRIDFDLLRREFAKTKKKNLLITDLDELIQTRLDSMLKENPSRVDYYERYQTIIDEYNNEQDRAIIEKTFMDLMNLANSMNQEEKRYVREGFTSDEELSLYDMYNVRGRNTENRWGKGI